MGLELRPLLGLVRTTEKSRCGGIECLLSTWHGRQVALVECGVGKVNAAMAAQALIDSAGCTTLVVCGVAGSVSSNLEPGDVLIADRLHQFDVATIRPDSWSPIPFGVQGARGARSQVWWLEASPHLVALAREQVKASRLPNSFGRSPTVKVGGMATGDALLLWPEALQAIAHRLGVLAVDMESAAVAQVAGVNGVECLVIRGISDRAEELATLNLEEILALGAGESGSVRLMMRAASYFLAKPRGLGDVLRLGRAMQRAAGNAAAVADQVIAAWPSVRSGLQ